MQISRAFFSWIDQDMNDGLDFKCCCSIRINLLSQIGSTAKSIGAGQCGPVEIVLLPA